MSFVIPYEPNKLNHPSFHVGTGTSHNIENKNAEKSIDSFHDDLAFEFDKSKPGTWEDIAFENTRIHDTDDGTESNQIIKNILSSYGRCVVIDEESTGDGKIPYRLPEQNECFIKDCFPGFSVPGLNNLLDQSTVSLKTFIEYHKTQGIPLENPLKTGGGLHIQLPEKFPHTAYFNYDILIFNHIKENIEYQLDEIKSTKDILFINTVNLNFLWCNLLLYCEKSVENDKYLNPTDKSKTPKDSTKPHLLQYKSALTELKKIRFDGFQINADGYISNPLFTMRDQKSKILTDDEVNYITILCNTIYGDRIDALKDAQPPLQYITSQAMAATSILKKIGKQIKSVISRLIGSKKKDNNKEACKKKVDDIFKNGGLEKHGWNILKFSGDSSHIVIGNIIEHISDKHNLNIDIRYLVSERPLAARLLSTQKSVIIFKTNVVMNNFNGPGSENKEHRHAALSVVFDPSSIIENIIAGFETKYQNVYNDNPTEKYIKTKSDKIEKDFLLLTDVNIGSAETQFALTLQSLTSLNKELSKLKVDPKTALTNIFTLMNGAKTKELLDVYDIDNAIYDINQVSTDFINLAKDAIGTRIGFIRITVKMNWKGLIGTLTTTPAIQDEFNDLQKVVSLLAFLYEKVDKMVDDTVILSKDEVDTILTKLLEENGFKEFYKKIKHFYGTDEQRSSVVEDIRTEWQNSKKRNSDSIPNNVELIIQEFQNLIVNFSVIFGYNTTRQLGGNLNSIDDFVEIDEESKEQIIETRNGEKKIKMTQNIEANIKNYYIEEFLSKEFIVETNHEYARKAAKCILDEMNMLFFKLGVMTICGAIEETHFTERISRYYSEEKSELTNFMNCELVYYNAFKPRVITLDRAKTLYKSKLKKDIEHITNLNLNMVGKDKRKKDKIMSNITSNFTLNYKNIDEIITEMEDIYKKFNGLKSRLYRLTDDDIVNMVKIRNEYNTFISSHQLLQDDNTQKTTDRHPRIIEKIIEIVGNIHGGRTRKKRESRKQNKLNNQRQTSKRHRKRRTKRRGKTVQK